MWHILLFTLFASPTFARWADTTEAGYAVTKESAVYTVEKDGRYVVEVEHEIEILKENARQDAGLTRLTFDAHASKFELEEAYTKNGDKISKVRPEHIEIKPLASSGAGFDEQRQVTIAFPDVNVGSRVYYKYRRDVHTPAIAGLFSVQYAVGWGEWQRQLSIKYDSAVPLYLELHDPEGNLTSTSRKKGDRYEITIELVKPVYRALTEEDDTNMDVTRMPWIAASSAKNWETFPKQTPLAYETIVSSGELPPRFQAIYEKAKGTVGDVNQINLVTSELQKAVRYVGDWAPVEGLYHPRPLAVVADTGFGDCKDFATSTATILRKLGFNAHVAWTNRGNNWSEAPLSLPTGAFNHAIVHAEKNSREYWLDPTNNTSFAQGLYEDIAGREAVVLDPNKLAVKQIPAADPEQSHVDILSRVHFGKDHVLTVDGEFTLRGRAVLGMTGSQLSSEKSHIDYQLVTWLTDAGNLIDWKLPPFDFRSRIVKDFKTTYSYRKRWNPVRTSAGTGYIVAAPPYLGQFQFAAERRVSGLYLQDPKHWHRRTVFLGKKALLKAQPSCRVRSDWLDFSRRFAERGGTLELDEEVHFKRSPIPASELHTPAFALLQKQVSDCLQPSVVVFQ